MAYGSITRFRKELFDIVGPQLDDDPYVILKQNEPVAVVLGVQEYRALIAAQRIVQDPAAVREIIAAHDDLDSDFDRKFYPLDSDPTAAEAESDTPDESEESDSAAEPRLADAESEAPEKSEELVAAYERRARAG